MILTKLLRRLSILFFVGAGTIVAQNVAINTTGAAADPSSMLDVSSTTNGILVPRVALSMTTVAAPVTAPANSLLVFNTATAGDVTPGYYYWSSVSSTWVRFATGTGWLINGNAGTSVATNFMGSTDNVSVAFRTNNIEVFRMTNTQRVGIGTTAPAVKLEVNSANADAFFGHSNNVGAYIGYETNFSFGVPAQNINGAGVWASNPAAGYTSSYAQSTGSATVAANINYSNVWMATYNLVDNASATYNPSASYNQLNVSNATLGGTQIALRGWSDRGTVAGNPGYTVAVQGLANTQNQDAMGVQGLAFTNAGLSFGGYFEGLTYAGASWAYAYVGGTPNGATARKIVGTGTVSEIIPTEEHGRITLTCPESPEYWYQDYGSINLINGKAHVDLDPILADIIVVDDKNPIRAIFTPQDMLNFNGATIANITPAGFDVIELNGGTNNGVLQYQITVKPKTNFGEGRFPQAPGPGYLKSDKEPLAAKTINQPKAENVFHWPADHIVYKYNPEDMINVGDVVPAGPNAGKIKTISGFLDITPVSKTLLGLERY